METIDRLRQSLIAYYPLRENAQDYSPNHYDGSVSPEVRFNEGIWGLAGDFTVPDAHIKLPMTLDRYASQYTVSAWVKLKELANIDNHASNEGTVVGRLAVSHQDGRLSFAFYYDSVQEPDNQLIMLTSQTGLAAGQWSNVVITYDHTTRKFAFYIDGELDVEYDLSRRVQQDHRPQLPWAFSIGGGAHLFGADEAGATLNGFVSDVIFFSSAADQAAVDFLTSSAEYEVSSGDGRKRFLFFIIAAAALGLLSAPSSAAVNRAPVTVTQTSSGPPPPNIAKCTPSNPPKTPKEIAECIRGAVGEPATKFVRRSDIGVDEDIYIHLDIGGEGHGLYNGIETGWETAINVNEKRKHSQAPFIDIPNLVLVTNFKATEPPYPFADRFADYITMQNAILEERYVGELARCIRPGKHLDFWIDRTPEHMARLRKLADMLGGHVHENVEDEFLHSAIRGAGNPKTRVTSRFRV